MLALAAFALCSASCALPIIFGVQQHCGSPFCSCLHTEHGSAVMEEGASLEAEMWSQSAVAGMVQRVGPVHCRAAWCATALRMGLQMGLLYAERGNVISAGEAVRVPKEVLWNLGDLLPVLEPTIALPTHPMDAWGSRLHMHTPFAGVGSSLPTPGSQLEAGRASLGAGAFRGTKPLCGLHCCHPGPCGEAAKHPPGDTTPPPCTALIYFPFNF